jgi:hypothetical protein
VSFTDWLLVIGGVTLALYLLFVAVLVLVGRHTARVRP